MNISKLFLGIATVLACMLGTGCETCFNCECPVVIIVNGQETPGGRKEVSTCDVDEQRTLEQDDDCTCNQI